MSKFSNQTLTVSHLSQAHAFFNARQYAEAIREYTSALKQPNLSAINQLLLQCTIAILYIHLNNYPQAHRRLTELSLKLSVNFQSNSGRSINSLQELLIGVKVEGSLALIELANANHEHVYSHMDTLLSYVRKGSGAQERETLYASAVKILFGFTSFEEITNSSQQIVSMHMDSPEEQNSQAQILMLSLAITQQLMNNLELAYQLSSASYEISKSKSQVIPMIIAVKHLLHLSKQLKLSKTITELYQNQLNRLMNTPEIYGISQQTLFRNYEQKIECGVGMTQIMWDYEQNCLAKERAEKYKQSAIKNEEWLKHALIQRLKIHVQSQNSSYNSNSNLSEPMKSSVYKIIELLRSSQNSEHILKFMKESQLVRQVTREYINKLREFETKIRRYSLGVGWRSLIMLPPKVNAKVNAKVKVTNVKQSYYEEDEYEEHINKIKISNNISYQQYRTQNDPQSVQDARTKAYNSNTHSLNHEKFSKVQKSNLNDQPIDYNTLMEQRQERPSRSPRSRKIEHVNVIKKSPKAVQNDNSPFRHLKIARTENSPYKNYNNQVYLQQKSVLVDPLQEVYGEDRDLQKYEEPTPPPLNYNSKSFHSQNASNQNFKLIQPKQPQSNSHQNFTQISYRSRANTQNQNLLNKNRRKNQQPQIRAYMREEEVIQYKNGNLDKNITDVMSILKLQNSRMQVAMEGRGEQKEYEKNVSMPHAELEQQKIRTIAQQEIEKQILELQRKEEEKFYQRQQLERIEHLERKKKLEQQLEVKRQQLEEQQRKIQQMQSKELNSQRMNQNNPSVLIPPQMSMNNTNQSKMTSNMKQQPPQLNNTNRDRYQTPSPVNKSKSNRPLNELQIKQTRSTIENNRRLRNQKFLNSPLIRKIIKICNSGQYFVKRHYSSDGGQEKFVQINTAVIKWAVNENKISSKYQSYKLKDIKGVAYGKVSETFLKDCNKKLEPWKCFSLILQKRTLDFYCTEEQDPDIWLPGITASLSGQTIPLGKEEVPISLYSPGRVLWKKILMKLQSTYIKPLQKKQKKPYSNANAYAIIEFGKSLANNTISKSPLASKSKSLSKR